uniref:Hypothetical chloroplast RF36 n=1 Tax=Dasya binghamiae TaxID=1896963 RepID=A0A1C8XS44_9FLOR|nr:hypothetical chloroplast RF36 [Dasya binghamiae]AOH77316.1 hypothetical chloroplast RF36 [Dasya binghamiae]
MPSIKKDFPVPFDQQPLNEYLELKKSCFFAWSTYDIKQYIYIILVLFFCLFIICGFLVFLFLFNLLTLSKLLILNFLLIDIIFIFIFIRLYLGWSYIIKRLLSATIFYEESGWYDGQVWIKTAENLTRDRLLGLYQIMPLLDRMKYSCIIFCINFVLHYYLYSLF